LPTLKYLAQPLYAMTAAARNAQATK